jgi:imidazoleglycerol-phosphate dehydratase / histidinol-phosphatase
MSGKKVLFIDRDGTIIEEPPDEQIDTLEKVRLIDGVIPALLQLQNTGYMLVMVSNQDGLGTAKFPKETFERPHDFLSMLLNSQGIRFAAEFFCPHFPNENCECRKPKTGLLTDFLKATEIDREHSYVIGDRETDMQLAKNLGVKGIRIRTATSPGETWSQIAERLVSPNRSATLTRKTKETDIVVQVNLDRESPVQVTTGIGFFDHMLEQIARHGGFSLNLACKGDLQIDEHHTVEDCAIALGTALKQALGDKRGIARFGFLLPMDESLAQIAIDLSGRGYFVFDGKFNREHVGQLPTELVPHFFRSLADNLGAAINIKVSGENTHHMVEACFKGVGRALRQAFRIEGAELPSSKGVL